MIKPTRKMLLNEFLNMMIMVAGALCLSIAMYMFMLPSKFIPGGVSGLTIIIQTLSNFPASYSMLILNSPLIVLAFIFLKKEFAIKTTIGIGMTSGFLAIFRAVKLYEFFNPNEVWLSALAGGVIGGIGIGLMVKGGGSSGGTEVISLLVQKRYIASSMSFIILAINTSQEIIVTPLCIFVLISSFNSLPFVVIISNLTAVLIPFKTNSIHLEPKNT